MEDCIFCKIVAGKIPCTKVYEDETTLAFNDISPKAPIHVVVIPKKHVSNIMEAAKDKELLAAAANAVGEVAKVLDIDKNGFRTVANTGHDGGQSVDHFHFHVLAGKAFGENFG